MNSKGQTVFLSIVIGSFLFVSGMVLLNFIDETLWNDGEDSLINELDCDNSDISDGTKLTCLIGEAVVPFFILSVISAAGGIITARFLV